MNNSFEHLNHLDPQVQQIIHRVLQLEQQRLDRQRHTPINEDIINIIKDVVRS
jgi:hypothetical protein